MKNNNNQNIIIALLVVIIIILATLVVLFATDKIILNTDKNIITNNGKDNISDDDNIDNKEDNIGRNDIVLKLKDALTNQAWVKENLYEKENCFGEKVKNTNQPLTFTVLSDKENIPIVIVSNHDFENYIVASYKVYYKNGEILVQNINNSIGHPSHVSFKIDKDKKLVISSYLHMGAYSFVAYDITGDEIKIYDEYECTPEDCNYDYSKEKNYNLSNISIELNSNNINTYLQ